MAQEEYKGSFHPLGDPELDKVRNENISPDGSAEQGGLEAVARWQDVEIMKAQADSAQKDAVSRARSFAFERRKRLPYLLSKGLQKPGSVSFEVLRRAANSVHVVRICINVLKEKVTKTKWAIQPIDPTKKVTKKNIEQLEEFFRHPNKNNETLRTFLDKILEDLLVLDAVSIEKTRYPDGTLAELHYVDAATIRPVYDEHGNQDIILPVTNAEGKDHNLPVSYVQVIDSNPYGGRESGLVVGMWPKKDMLYFNMHPQGSMAYFGYGLSPIESVMGVVANILNADNYNGAYFEEGSFPPMIVHLKGSMGQRELQSLRTYLYNELEGKYYRPAIVSGEGEMEVHDLKELNRRDMQFMEYMKFMATLLSAAYGLSPQDIGLLEDTNRSTSETMKDLSQAKGYGSILSLIEEIFNQEIVWKDFGFTDLEFKFVATDTTDPLVASQIHDAYLKAGALTLNEVRKKIGETPFDEWADVPMVLTTEGYKPVLATPDEAKEVKDGEEEPSEKVEPGEKEEADETPDVVGGETPYDEQAEGETEDIEENDEDASEESDEDEDAVMPKGKRKKKVQKFEKSLFTDDGRYEVYLDDRGVGQPFIFYDIITRKGFVIKPPVAVNFESQKLEETWTNKLSDEGLNVVPVRRISDVNIIRDVLPSEEVRSEFFKYQHLLGEYGSKKWEQRNGASRRFAYYSVSEFVDGSNLKMNSLIEDMKRVPKDYTQAIHDLADLWKAEKRYVLGDRRADQYIITPDKRAWGFDYQFVGNKSRWEGTKEALENVLTPIPYLKELFLSLTQTRIDKIKKSIFGTKKTNKTV